MKLTMTAPRTQLAAWPGSTASDVYRAAGLLIAAGVPTLFWTGVLVLWAKLLGIDIAPAFVGGFGLSIATCTLLAANAVMGHDQ